MKRLLIAAALIAGLFIVVFVARGVVYLQRNETERYDDIREHFKYGSFGSEARLAVPEPLWMVMPDVFADLLPEGEGEGWERFGFIYEPGRDRPIGTTLRKVPVPLIGLNCAVCHTGTVRFEPGGAEHVYLGMPAHEFDLQAWARFLFAAAADERWDTDLLIDAMQDAGAELSWIDRQLYRYVVLPQVQDVLEDSAADFFWFDTRPDQGPGRVDTFNPYKVYWNDEFPGAFDMAADQTIGTADLPSLWLQGPRDGMNLHWDGNNPSLFERNISAAIGAGASEDSLEIGEMRRIAAWIDGLAPPRVPDRYIEWDLVGEGAALYAIRCASCHAFDGAEVGQIVPIGVIGTDPHRLESFGEQIAEYQNRLGGDRWWGLDHFTVTDGYANSPLDGAWLRAPYLHNGSVPTMRDLLAAPDDRPDTFYRGYDVYDFADMGFVSSGAEAERLGFLFDTSLPGNGNEGHTYGVDLTQAEKDALIEYLKTL